MTPTRSTVVAGEAGVTAATSEPSAPAAHRAHGADRQPGDVTRGSAGPVTSWSPTCTSARGSSGTNVSPSAPRPLATPSSPVRTSRAPTPEPGSAASSTTGCRSRRAAPARPVPAPSVTVCPPWTPSLVPDVDRDRPVEALPGPERDDPRRHDGRGHRRRPTRCSAATARLTRRSVRSASMRPRRLAFFRSSSADARRAAPEPAVGSPSSQRRTGPEHRVGPAVQRAERAAHAAVRLPQTPAAEIEGDESTPRARRARSPRLAAAGSAAACPHPFSVDGRRRQPCAAGRSAPRRSRCRARRSPAAGRPPATGTPSSCCSRASSPRSSAPPPVSTMPPLTRSPASSGGQRSSVARTAAMMRASGGSIALRSSSLEIVDVARQAGADVAAADLGLPRAGLGNTDADRDLQLLGGALADEQRELGADVVDDRGVQRVAGHPYAGRGDDAAEGEDGDLGRPASDVDHHRARGLVDRQPGTDRGRHRLGDRVHPPRAGSVGGLAHRPLLHAGDTGRDADDDARSGERAAPAQHLAHEVAQHLGGDVVVGDHAVLQRADRRGCDRACGPIIRLASAPTATTALAGCPRRRPTAR